MTLSDLERPTGHHYRFHYSSFCVKFTGTRPILPATELLPTESSLWQLYGWWGTMHCLSAVAGLLALIASVCFHWLSSYNLPLPPYWLVLICWSQWCDVIFIVIYVIVSAVATYSYKLAVTLAFDIKVNSFKLLGLDQYRAGACYPILSAAAVPMLILEMMSPIAWGNVHLSLIHISEPTRPY